MMKALKGRDESASCKGLTKQPNVGELKTFGCVGFGIHVCMIIWTIQAHGQKCTVIRAARWKAG